MDSPARCPHCHQETLAHLPTGSVHCTNRGCNGYFVTLSEPQYRALTPAQLAAYQTGRTPSEPVQPRRIISDAQLDAMMERSDMRQAVRAAGERLFG